VNKTGAAIDQRVIEAVEGHVAVQRVRLVGSRASGTAMALSDWDFAVETDNFSAVARDIGSVLAALQPLAQQWDRLSETHCWLVILPGPIKVDLNFAEPHDPESPWCPEPTNLASIDCHLWDWALWLRSKEMQGRFDLVVSELHKIFDHILRPMGVRALPTSLDAAVACYLVARSRLEHDFGVKVSRALEREAGRDFFTRRW
jgi:predicted nucleotidyltransferase